MKSFFISIAFVLLTINSALAASSLCDGRVSGRQLSFTHQVKPRTTNEVVLLNWNAYKFSKDAFWQDFNRLAQEADIITLQEAMHDDEIQRMMSNTLPFLFSFNMSFCSSEKQATGVLNMSRFPISANKTLVSPDTEPVTNTPKVSGYSAVQVPQFGLIHIINIHALNFNFGTKFENHIKSVAEFIKTLQGPVVWTGDFNTWSSGRMSYLDKTTKTLNLTKLDLKNDTRGQKLDHVYVRGLKIKNAEVLNQIQSSDHFPVLVKFETN